MKDAHSTVSVGRKGSRDQEVGRRWSKGQEVGRRGSKGQEVGSRGSLRQVDRRESKSSSRGLKGQDVLRKRSSDPATGSASATLQASTSQPEEKGIEQMEPAPQLSEAMVNNILRKLDDIRSRQSRFT